MESKKLNTLFDEFTKKMNQRLVRKERAGFTGWDDQKEYSDEELRQRIITKLMSIPQDKTDIVDIANYAMFLYERKKQ